MLLDTRFNKLTEAVIGCAMQVHRLLGPGFPEVIYQRSLAVELEQAGVVFGREIEMPIFYKGVEVGSRRVDFLVEEMVLVELKALHELKPDPPRSNNKLPRSLPPRSRSTHQFWRAQPQVQALPKKPTPLANQKQAKREPSTKSDNPKNPPEFVVQTSS
jgi:GxxExxY protein